MQGTELWRERGLADIEARFTLSAGWVADICGRSRRSRYDAGIELTCQLVLSLCRSRSSQLEPRDSAKQS
jgi:hypothetical protein